MLGLIRKRRFLSGIVTGIALAIASVVLINNTTIADWIVAPLLVPDRSGDADAVVVLGAGVIGDCVPNNTGLRRVIRGVQEWRRQPSAVLLFTGGVGTSCRVAEAMARVARQFGIPEDRLRLETASVNTHENAELSAALLRGWGASRILVVTDRLHMRRASATFDRAGIPHHRASVPIYEGHPDNVSMLVAGLREYAALAYYRMRGWIGSPEPEPQTMSENWQAPHERPNRHDGPIVILGASYAASWPLEAIAGIPVVNKGIAGQQAFELLERFDADVLPAAPRAVVLWGFINDIFRANPEGMDAAVARVKDSYLAMIARARANGIQPILATEVTARPRSETLRERLLGWVADRLGRQAYQDHINRHVLAVNEWLRQTAARERLLLLDLQPVVSAPGGRRRPAFAQTDGSHLTPAGYDMLTAYARPVLQEYFVGR